MKEKDFRKQIVQMLKPLRAFAVENDVHDGCPDVCCVAGWIELKVATSPVRSTTPVNIGLRPAQRVWLKMWRQHGGRAWTLMLLDNHYVMLHDGHWAAEYYDTATSELIMDKALMIVPLTVEGRAILPMALQKKLLEPMTRIQE